MNVAIVFDSETGTTKAAAEAMGNLSILRLPTPIPSAPAIQTTAARIGVFVCECGLNIAGTVDCAAVSEYAETLDDVVAVVQNKYTCADPGQNEIKKAIKEHNLTGVIVAACSPTLHEATFRRAGTAAGPTPPWTI